MHIQSIVISGFRSYREQLFPEGFSPRTNVIVGKNGSGKSNFFAAIQFVLSEKYVNLTPNERKELFHLGSGKPALSVFVEIIFDNTDGRLVLPGRAEEKEVRIRRTVGLKQDEYRVNDRKFSAAEVRQLLESAGLSSSNPYNIVEQGQITSLANMSEESRFQLIKDVAGTKVYESRRDDSKKILVDTTDKLAQVDQSIQKLDDRLKELEGDTKELREFQRLDDEKKVLEYSIFKAELEHTRKQLAAFDEEWHAQLRQLNSEKDQGGSVETEVRSCWGRIAQLNAQMQSLEQEKASMEKEMAIANSKQVVAELDATTAVSQRTRGEAEHAALQKEHTQLQQTVTSTTQKWNDHKKQFATMEQDSKSLLNAVDETQRVVDSLQERRNRSTLFKNKKERDAWIRNEIQLKTHTIQKATKEKNEMTSQVKEVSAEISALQQQIQTSSKSAAGSEQELLQREKQIATVSAQRDALNQERRKLWQEIHEQEAVVHRAREAADMSRQQYERSVRHDIRQGLHSLEELLQEMNDPVLSSKVKGSVIELMRVEAGFAPAVDATAGNALFNVVVDSFATSAFLLEQMNKRRKPGRLTFLPLDILREGPTSELHGRGGTSAFRLPTTPEVFPLRSKVSVVDPSCAKVMDEMFGRTAVVAQLDVGARLIKEAVLVGCDVVTVDGDQLSRKGGITGGYIDQRKLKLVTYEAQKSTAQAWEAEKLTFDSLCQRVAEMEQKITGVLHELELLRNGNVSTEKSADATIRETRQWEDRLRGLRARKAKMETAMESLEKLIQDTSAAMAYLKKEATEDFKSTWNPEDEAQLHTHSERLSTLKTRSFQVQDALLQLATQVQLEEDTASHLQQRMKVVEDRLRELGRLQRHVAELNQESAAVNVEYTLLVDRLRRIDHDLDAARKERDHLESKVQSITTRQLSLAKELEEQQGALARLESKRSLLVQRQEEIQIKIRRLGVDPNAQHHGPLQQQLLATYANHSIAKLMHHLKQVHHKLQKLSHVNRKAVDQYNLVLQSRTDLDHQRQTLLEERRSIEELLDHLETEKDAVIERTYKQIQFQFEEVFKELVGNPDCSAQLLLVKSKWNSPSLSTSTSTAEAVEEYTGARLQVSFTPHGSLTDLEHLSGGQKTLVALALVFAIQRCDPAPFYLLDEVDAALDAEYRAAVARVVAKQSTASQFIFTTFKTEMLRIADKVLGIFFHNKVTRIQSISPEEGEQLLLQQHEGGAGAEEPTTTAGSQNASPHRKRYRLSGGDAAETVAAE